MRFMIGGQGWPVQGGARLIPAGTIVGDGGIPVSELPTPMPINAVALDTDAALAMAMAYNETDSINGWHQLVFAPSVNRAAVFAQARLNKQWPPNGIPPARAMAPPAEEEPPAPAVPRTSKKRK